MSVAPAIHSDDHVDIGSIDDVPRRGARCVTKGDMRIAIFRTHDDQFFLPLRTNVRIRPGH